MARVLALLLMLLPMAAAGQDRAQTLADIRQELSALHVEVQRLKGELNTTGLPAAAGVGGDTLARVDAIEQALARLTARTEELQFRIERIVEDGTNRIADLEFRLVELEGGDVSRLRETTTLGGAQAAGVRPVGALPDTGPDTGA
ncbi:MAG: tol-pal system protein, partial [Rhodobacteraceae bacterium]|nr:tol-pal system protein [Paracoccaceae bacterium]